MGYRVRLAHEDAFEEKRPFTQDSVARELMRDSRGLIGTLIHKNRIPHTTLCYFLAEKNDGLWIVFLDETHAIAFDAFIQEFGKTI